MFTRSTYKDGGATTVTLITPDPRLEKSLLAAFAKQNRLALKVLRGTIPEREQQLLAIEEQAPLILEINPRNSNDLAVLERVRKADGGRRPIIVVTERLDEGTLRQFFRLHITDWISKAKAERDVLPACERAIEALQTAPSGVAALCYTFVSANGGAGATTLAIQTAFLLARKTKRFDKTCLVDLNFQDGTLAEYLNVTPNLQLQEIMSTPQRLDAHLLEVMLSRHESGIAVVAAPNSFTEVANFNPQPVTLLLDLISASFEHVIIDLPRIWTVWSRDVLVGSNKVFVVGEMTVPGLRRARILADGIRTQCGETLDVSVIMNKDRRGWFGSFLRSSDAQRVLGARLAGFVSYQESAVREAIDRGLPLYRVKSSNKIDKDLSLIVLPR